MDVPLGAFEKEEAMMIDKFFSAIKTAKRIEYFSSTWYVEELVWICELKYDMKERAKLTSLGKKLK
jgi:hypothetical protein